MRRHGVDAGIFFSDIVVPLKLAGVEVEIVPGVGPVLATPCAPPPTSRALPALGPTRPSHPIREAVALTVEQLGSTPLIGFAGAPFTLAAYLVEGGPSPRPPAARAPDARRARRLGGAGNWAADVTGAFLRAQVWPAPAPAQLFDSWAGSLSLADYTDVRRPGLAPAPCDARARPGRADGALRHRHQRAARRHARRRRRRRSASTTACRWTRRTAASAADIPLQGNIDPALLGAPWPVLEAHVRDVLAAGDSAPGTWSTSATACRRTPTRTTLTRVVELIHSIAPIAR